MSKTSHIQVICMGEILIDFIGSHTSKHIASTTEFKRYLGGSPANVAMNLKKLGCNAALVATIGDDGLGDFLLQEMQALKMPVQFIRKIASVPTSAILVSKTTDTPDFIAYREADSQIIKDQISNESIENATVFHTTCFALSRNPARKTILSKAKIAAQANDLLSIDLNYSEKIWANKEKAIEVIKQYCAYKPIVKISLDDMERLYGNQITEEALFQKLHSYGAPLVCLTRGGNGVRVSQIEKELIEMPAIPLKSLEDATGAGDAFWAGFLCAHLQNKPIERCVQFALEIASIKLTTIGGLPDLIGVKP